MDIFEFSSYKTYVVTRVEAMQRKGHGQFAKIARHIGVNPVVVTQVLRGPREFSEEQGLKLADYLGLGALETDFFMRLIAIERAGTHELKQYHRAAMDELRKEALKVKNRVSKHRELDDATKSIFYSDWTYSAVRLLTSIEAYRDIDAIAEHLGLNRSRVNEIMELLLEVGLCARNVEGKLVLGQTATHLDAQSRFINGHRRNWRLKGLEALNQSTPEELFYSGPCTLSVEDFQALKTELLAVISSLSKRVPKTKPENLACLNIDWFRI